MTNDEVMRKALHRAFSLGQTYWHQADSESYAANKRADVTLAKFNTLVEGALAHLSARPGPQAAVSEEEIEAAFSSAWDANADARCAALSRGIHGMPMLYHFARAVLAASRQVPVGWVDGLIDFMRRNDKTNEEIGNALVAAGYASPSPLPVGEPRQEEGERSGSSGVERMEQALRDQEAHFEKVYADGVPPTEKGGA